MFAIVMSLASPVHAETAAPSAWPQPTDTIVVTGMRVRSNNAPKPPSPAPDAPASPAPDCASTIPTGLTVGPDTGPTLFSYRLAIDGSVHDASLVRSSGVSALDQAALACANGAHRPQAFVAGAPAEITWTGGIRWASGRPVFFDPSPDGAFAAACNLYYPSHAVMRGQQGTAVIGFRIGMDGLPTDETVVASSGSASLDEGSEKCIDSFRYFPATRNGKPVKIDRSVRIDWRLESF